MAQKIGVPEHKIQVDVIAWGVGGGGGEGGEWVVVQATSFPPCPLVLKFGMFVSAFLNFQLSRAFFVAMVTANQNNSITL